MYFPELNDNEREILEQLLYRTSRLIYLEEGGLREFFDATDVNHNGLLEKEEIEAGYKGQNAEIEKTLDKDLREQKGPLSQANIQHVKKIYKKCGESLNSKVQELIKEYGLQGKIEISYDQLAQYYEGTYDRAVMSLAPKNVNDKIVKTFQKYVEGILSSPPNVINDVKAKFAGVKNLEDIFARRKAGRNEMGYVYFDLVWLYMFFVYTKPEEELGGYFKAILDDPQCMFESLQYYRTIIECLLGKLV